MNDSWVERDVSSLVPQRHLRKHGGVSVSDATAVCRGNNFVGSPAFTTFLQLHAWQINVLVFRKSSIGTITRAWPQKLTIEVA
jgi:hypothetical protein